MLKDKSPLKLNRDTLYSRCLYRLVELSTNAQKDIDPVKIWEDVDRLVLEVSRQYVPGKEVDKIIEHITTNLVYGFTDDIPF